VHYYHNIQNHPPESSNEISELMNLLPVNTGNQAASDDGCEVCSIQKKERAIRLATCLFVGVPSAFCC